MAGLVHLREGEVFATGLPGGDTGRRCFITPQEEAVPGGSILPLFGQEGFEFMGLNGDMMLPRVPE